MANATLVEGDLLVGILVNYQLLAPYGEHWVYDTPLFGLCLEATRNTAVVSEALCVRRFHTRLKSVETTRAASGLGTVR